MAGLDLIAVQDVIEAYIKAQFPGYTVYDEDVLDDEAILKIDGKAKPYMILVWGGLSRSTANTSFAGTRYDEYNSSLDIVIAAPNSRQARRSLNVVRDKLIGWKPTGGGAMTSIGGDATSVVNNTSGRPHVYLAACRFDFAVNSENVGAYITP
jgi:hypothetical protein